MTSARPIQTEQQSVNKAIVDVETARDNAVAAQHDLEVSQQAVKDANAAIAAAQHRFDTFAAATYMNGPSGSYLTASSPDDIIATETAARTLTASSQTVMDNLQRARTEQVNKESAARPAKQKADKAAADAKSSQDAAVAALTDSKRKFDEQREEVNRLAAERDEAQASLQPAATRGTRGGPAPGRARCTRAGRPVGSGVAGTRRTHQRPQVGRLGPHAAHGAQRQRPRRPDRGAQPGAGDLGHLDAGHRPAWGRASCSSWAS